jgi:predicted transcriptional regulator
MKHLIVSLKTPDEILQNFKEAYKAARHKKIKASHYEVSFDNKKGFDRFVHNLHILKYVLFFKPKSIYELARITQMDVSNLNKVIIFFEEIGAITVQTKKVSGRIVKKPVVNYDTIEFRLAA